MTEPEQLAAARAEPRWLHKVLSTLVATVFLEAGIVLVLYPYASGREMPGDLVDSRFILCMLEFFYRAALSVAHGQPSHFLNAPFFYPWPRVTSFADTFWGDAEFYAFFRILGLGPLSSYRDWFVLGFGLTYISTFLSARKFGFGVWGASVTSFLFTFPLPMAAQFGHAQLVYRLWMPPALLAFHRFVTRGSLRAGASCILFVALQLAVSIYLGLFLGLLLASYAIALCLVGHDRPTLPRWTSISSTGTLEIVTTGILLILGLVVLAVVGIPYLKVQAMYGFARQWQDVVVMLPRPGSYLLAGPSSIWPNLSSEFHYPFEWEHQLFPGLSAIIPIAWFSVSAQARARCPLAAPVLVAAAIIVIITIDIDGHSIYPLIYLCPGFASIRAVTRIIFALMLPLAMLLGMLVDDLASGGAHRQLQRVISLALTLFLILECSAVSHYSSLPKDWRARLQALESKLPKTLPNGAVLAIATQPRQPKNMKELALQQMRQTDAELAAVMLEIRTVNGYSGNVPPTWKPIGSCHDLSDDLRAGRHFLIEHQLPTPNVESDRLVLLGFGPCDVAANTDPVLQLDRTYRFSADGNGNDFIADGFSYPQGSARWMNAEKGFLFFTLTKAPPGAMSVAIEAYAILPAAAVTIITNGHICGSFKVTEDRASANITCPAGVFHAGENVLQLRIGQLTWPLKLGISGDGGRLGIGLKSLTLKSAG